MKPQAPPADDTRPASAGSADAVDRAIAAFEPSLPIAIAFSAGADSTALLYACVARWPGQVSALHVNHGLQAAAPVFEAHCRAVCATLGIAFESAHPQAHAAPGESPEAAARFARYSSFDALAQFSTTESAIVSIAIGQHADDQVETLLLALSRGAGIAGLAGMPQQWKRGAIDFHRPLLRVSRADIRAWLRLRPSITWMEDPSNLDERFVRNRIRSQLMPALSCAFPAFLATFARSAAHAAEAESILQEIAQTDLLTVGVPPSLGVLQSLSKARRAQVLRRWLRLSHGTTPETRQLVELQRQIDACRTRGHAIELRVGAGMIVRVGENIDWYNLHDFSLILAARESRFVPGSDDKAAWHATSRKPPAQ